MKTKLENPEISKSREKYMWLGYGYHGATFPSSGNPDAVPNPDMLERFLLRIGLLKKPVEKSAEKES